MKRNYNYAALQKVNQFVTSWENMRYVFRFPRIINDVSNLNFHRLIMYSTGRKGIDWVLLSLDVISGIFIYLL